jgi:cell division protein FtsB
VKSTSFGSSQSPAASSPPDSAASSHWFSRLLQPFRFIIELTLSWMLGTANTASLILQRTIADLKGQIAQLNQKNQALETENSTLKKQSDNYRDILCQLPPDQARTEEQIQQSRDEMRKKISQPLPYDPTRPLITKTITDPLSGKKVITLSPTAQKTSNPIQPLNKPALSDIRKMGLTPLNLTVPGQPEKPPLCSPHALVPATDPAFNRFEETDFTFDFNVKWGMTKCIRDLYQNFSDAHGRTLGGVKLQVNRAPDSTYTVRIQGEGEYSYHFVRNFISSKGADNEAAGGFGEGTKIMTLNLLRDHGAESVTFSSRNWAMEYSSQAKEVAGMQTRLMVRQLKPVTDQRGNYVEIKTKKPELVSAIINGVDLFYHPANTDFADPTINNKVGGFRYLGLDSKGKVQRGNVYVTRQRFEFKVNERWEKGPSLVTLWTHQNILKNLGIVDRDRLPLSNDQLETLAKAIAAEMSDEELIQTIFKMKEIWVEEDVEKAFDGVSDYNLDSHSPSRYSTGLRLLACLIQEAASPKRRLGVEFPKQYLADTGGLSDGAKTALLNLGFKFCFGVFSDIGMKNANDKFIEIGEHTALKPTEQEIKRINILKEAAAVLKSYPEIQKLHRGEALITEKDIKKNIYLFSKNEKRETQHTLAQYKELFIWFDREYLEKASFGEALGTYVHEMLHKIGGDGDPSFGYALTDALEGSLDLLVSMKPEDIQKLQDLRALWQETKPPKPAQK